MGFFSKIGKSIKKAVKSVGKATGGLLEGAASLVANVPVIGSVASAALSINADLVQGKVSSGLSKIPGALGELAGTALAVFGPAASAAPVAAAPPGFHVIAPAVAPAQAQLAAGLGLVPLAVIGAAFLILRK